MGFTLKYCLITHLPKSLFYFLTLVGFILLFLKVGRKEKGIRERENPCCKSQQAETWTWDGRVEDRGLCTQDALLTPAQPQLRPDLSKYRKTQPIDRPAGQLVHPYF